MFYSTMGPSFSASFFPRKTRNSSNREENQLWLIQSIKFESVYKEVSVIFMLF